MKKTIRKKRKKKTPRQKAHDILWELCKQYIRLRDKDTCQKCGKKVYGRSADTSHVYCKNVYYSMKYDEMNLKLLCMWCHKWWHNCVLESKDWFAEWFPERYGYLEARKRIVRKLTLLDLDDLIAEYKDKIADLKAGKELTSDM